MPAADAPVTLYGLISTVIVNRDECVNTTWDVDWQSLVDDGYMLVYDPPIACANVRDDLNNGDSGSPISDVAGLQAALDAKVAHLEARKEWARYPDGILVGTITRDANDAATAGAVVWPDGTPGNYTALTVSTAFPGAVDSYSITYGAPVTATYTQPAVTRNANGAVTNVPAIVVT